MRIRARAFVHTIPPHETMLVCPNFYFHTRQFKGKISLAMAWTICATVQGAETGEKTHAHL